MVLPRQHLLSIAFGENPMLIGFERKQVQIVSVDPRLGDKVHVTKCAGLPMAGETVEKLIERNKRYKFTMRPRETYPLHKGVCHIIPLKGELALSPDFRAVFSPKSSTGRCDVFVRVLTNGCPHYDRTTFGYQGPMYLEVVPLSFDIEVAMGLELTQFRVQGVTRRSLTSEEIACLHSKFGILRDKEGVPLPNECIRLSDGDSNGGLYYHVDLDRDIVGFEARRSAVESINLTTKDSHNPEDFWTPIPRPSGGKLVLVPGAFYLLATKERTFIPPSVCGQILPYDISAGEFRPHYAGFFDPGFGGEGGTVGVLEVRSRDMPFSLTHGQIVCRMDFEWADETPDQLYSGHYTDPRPSLSKHFSRRHKVWD